MRNRPRGDGPFCFPHGRIARGSRSQAAHVCRSHAPCVLYYHDRCSGFTKGTCTFARRDYIRDYMMIPPGTGEAAVVNVIVEIPKLLADLEPVWLARKAKQSASRPRRRKPGAGRKAKFRLADRLLLTLLYYRAYITQEFVGFLSGVDKGTVSREVQELSLCMAGVFRIPEKKVRIDPDDLEAVFVDATEQPVNRPKRGQRRSYSGKKKRHTVKHQVAVTRKRKGAG